MSRVALQAAALIAAVAFSRSADAEQTFQLGAGPQIGASVNADQWLIGGYGRLGGVCLFICGGDFGLSLHVLGGLGGNHATLRGAIRLDRVFWFGELESIGLYGAVAFTGQAFMPIGDFASFCDRTQLNGCGGIRYGFEAGLGLRVWFAFVEATLLSGQLPSFSLTAGAHFTLWEPTP